MARHDFRLEGHVELMKKFKDNMTLDDLKKVVRNNGSQLQRKAQRNADFRGHYEWEAGKGKVFKKPTGALKESIGLSMKDGGLTAEVEPGVEYAAYVELGTRFMDAQPYLKPAWNEQKKKFVHDMEKLTK